MRPALSLVVRLAPALFAALLAGCETAVEDLPQALKVLKSQPANGESGVSPDIVLRVQFDDELDPLSLRSGTLLLEPAVPGGLAAEGSFLTFTPYEPFALDTQYLAEVDGSLRGRKGGTLGGTHGFRFTTRGSNSDILPPAPITDLVGTVKGSTTVELVWSSTGDDGISGTATRYDLRWASGAGCPLKPVNFAAATAIPLPTPRPAGTGESTTVPNLPRKAFVCFALTAVDESGNASGLSNVVALTLPDLVPPNPPVVTLANASETAADLTWKAVGDDADEGLASDYTLYRHASADCEPLTPADAVIDGGTFTTLELPFPGPVGSTEQYSAGGLTRDSDYCFLLRVRDATGNAAWSNVLPVHTPDLTPPSRPVLAVTTALPTSIALEWTAVGDDGMNGTVTREEVEYAEGACPAAAAAFTPTASLPTLPIEGGGDTGVVVTGLKADTDHCFRVVVADNVGAEVKSNLAEAHTRDVVAPATPVLTVSNVGTSGADVSWVTEGDNDSDGQAFEEELRMARGAGCDLLAPGSFSQGDLVLQQTPPPAGTVQSTSLAGLFADEEYCVLLRVKDEAGLFATSALVRFKTLDLVAPAHPQLYVADGGVGPNRVTLEWLAVGDNGLQGTAEAQSLAYATGAECATFGTAAGVPGTTATLLPPRPPLSAEFAEVLGLDEDTPYCFQLSVQDEVGNGVRSAVVHATTKDETAPAIPQLVAQTLADGVSFQWRAVCENLGHPACGTPGYGTAASYQFVYRRSAPDGTCPVAPAGQGQQMMLRGSCGDGCTGGKVCAAVGTEPPSCRTPSGGCGSTCGSAYEACVALEAGGSACAAKLLTRQVTVEAPGYLHAETVEYRAGDDTLGNPSRYTGVLCAQVLVLDEAGNGAFSNEARNDKAVGADDLTAPSTVSNLRARLAHGVDVLDLQWTAPGDDGTSGTAASYALFMATDGGCVVPGQGDAFPADAEQVPLNATPGPSGVAQSDTLFVQGLEAPQGPVCFRLRAADDATPANVSAPSNLAYPPRPIGDLAAVTDANGDVQLSWKASGAHDRSDQAARYELHVRTLASGSCPTNPAAALALSSGLTPAFNATGPAAAGTPETGSISGITPGTRLCLVLEAFNLYGDSALSNVAALTVDDTTPPADFTLALATVTSTTATLTFSSTGDDGQNGTASRYELGLLELQGTFPAGVDPCACDANAGVSCGGGAVCIGSQCEDPFLTPVTVAAAGAVTVTGLAPDTHHCARMRALDDEGNAGYTPVVPFKTNPTGGDGDVDPPAAPVLAAFSPGDVRSTATSVPEADLSWLAVREDSADPASGVVTDYAVAYRTTGADGTTAVGGQADCDGLNALGAAALQAASTLSVALVGNPQPGDALTATASFTGVSAEQPLCVALQASDAAGNSALSGWRHVRDNTAPGQLANFKVTATGRDNVTLTVDATGDDGADGTATSYVLRTRAEACPGLPEDFDTTGLVPLAGTPTPGTPTFPDTLTATGLSPGTTYCFHLLAEDDAGLQGPPVTVEVTLPLAAAFDLEAVRAAVRGSPSLSITPASHGLTVSGAAVTYLKPDLGQGRAGAPQLDTLPGFFLQGSGTGPAVYVQLDPATAVAGGLFVGDRVDLSDVSATLMNPSGATDLQGVVVITSATVTKLPACTPPAQGQQDPCGPGFSCVAGACLVDAQDASNLAPGDDLAPL
ncbi:MAG: Ig-like domain-containing protein, partial [Deltaproteobacteria bacterium]|nr:Ig-like domain-containing protein [Deltaproteobacteria bacterium]